MLRSRHLLAPALAGALLALAPAARADQAPGALCSAVTEAYFLDLGNLKQDMPFVLEEGVLGKLIQGIAARGGPDLREEGLTEVAVGTRPRANGEPDFMVVGLRTGDAPEGLAERGIEYLAAANGAGRNERHYRGVRIMTLTRDGAPDAVAGADLADRKALFSLDAGGDHALVRATVDLFAGQGQSFRQAHEARWGDVMTMFDYGSMLARMDPAWSARLARLGLADPAKVEEFHASLFLDPEFPPIVGATVTFQAVSDAAADPLEAEVRAMLETMKSRLPAGSPWRDEIDGLDFQRWDRKVIVQGMLDRELVEETLKRFLMAPAPGA